jgi:hypothetical protein
MPYRCLGLLNTRVLTELAPALLQSNAASSAALHLSSLDHIAARLQLHQQPRLLHDLDQVVGVLQTQALNEEGGAMVARERCKAQVRVGIHAQSPCVECCVN